jgi:hypothetical protein
VTAASESTISATDLAAEELLDTSRLSVRRDPGPSALDTLGWWDLLGDLDDPIARFGVFGLFRAQGLELADTPAIGSLIASPYLAALGQEPGTTVAAVVHSSARRGEVALVLGDATGRDILVDLPGRAALLYRGTSLGRRRELPGRLTVTEVDLTSTAIALDLGDPERRVLRARALILARIAAAGEMLGAAEGAVDLAVAHARVREQFGQPIGAFQAVRHLLAWAETDTTAVAAIVRQAVLGLDNLPTHYDEIVKAVAGRNARRACERSLQVLGGIGFTAEHAHHHHHSRVLLLDSLLGTSAELTQRLGSRARETGTTPPLTEHALSLHERVS